MSRTHRLAAWAATALLLFAFMKGLWPAGFVALVPWLRLREARPGWRAACLDGLGLSLVLTAAGFAWFGLALGRYTGLGAAPGLLLLLALAPLFQPQCLAYALARRRPLWGLLAWLACEWLVPKLLGDTLGHGLYPAAALRQTAAWGGVPGLTLLLLASNEAVAHALRTRRWRAVVAVLGVTLGLAVAGQPRFSAAPAGEPLRAGLVQANLDAEALRREHGAAAALRRILDLHFAMSFDAVERQGAQLLLWSETVYPTPFGQPKSAAGAAFDAELRATLQAGGVPLVFGSFQRDEAGEYNAALLLDPAQGLVGSYRKTRLFPYSEWLPAALRGLLPQAGHWQPGDGARVLPLRAGGREFVVAPLICLDATDPALARDAARLGAQLLVNLSNDSWFAGVAGDGARLHLATAAFRSVETGLPQARVTHTGVSALIDARGEVQARAALGERSLVVGDLRVPQQPVPTLATRWGNWVGASALAVLLALLAQQGLATVRWTPPPRRPVPGPIPTPLRIAIALLRTVARVNLVALGALLLLDEGTRLQSWSTVRWLLGGVLLPEAAAACVRRAAGVPLPAPSFNPTQPLCKFGLLPLVLALPAFHLHQHIAYGSVWGEALAFGWPAWWRTLGLWWGGWLLLVLLLAAAWRAVVEGVNGLLRRWRPDLAAVAHQRLELIGLVLLYLGLPLWLGWRTL